MNFARNKFFIFGVAAGFGLLILYFSILTLANSFPHAFSQFSQFRYWILSLAAGFGTQSGLYLFIKEATRERAMKSPVGVVAATGGVSAASMVVCCLHHFVDVLSLIGLAVFALFLSDYQTIFLALGIFSNLIGIIIMLEIMQKNRLSESFTKMAGDFPMAKAKKIAIGASILTLLFLAFFQFNQDEKNASPIPQNDLSELSAGINSFPEKTDSSAGITYTVKLLDFKQNEPVRFEIEIDTHSGSLDFDLVKISVLEDSKGNKYVPSEWQGTGSGGHHRSGNLVFSKVDESAGKLKLTVKDDSQRVFEWDLTNNFQ